MNEDHCKDKAIAVLNAMLWRHPEIN